VITGSPGEIHVSTSPLVRAVLVNTGLRCDGVDVFEALNELVVVVKRIVDDFATRFF
jgi:hypothetical protein